MPIKVSLGVDLIGPRTELRKKDQEKEDWFAQNESVVKSEWSGAGRLRPSPSLYA